MVHERADHALIRHAPLFPLALEEIHAAPRERDPGSQRITLGPRFRAPEGKLVPGAALRADPRMLRRARDDAEDFSSRDTSASGGGRQSSITRNRPISPSVY
jgi:hypothetical protein